ncbi:hypothetical protein IFR05_015647 [Cadophora sp. M221]|nr:hypothetical protein IFR05_015647 [Cadophora sp. M221]
MADSRSDRIKDRKCWTKFNIEFQAQAYNRGLWPLVDPDGPDVPSPATNPPVFNTETEFLQKKNAERLAGAPAILFSKVESEYNRANTNASGAGVWQADSFGPVLGKSLDDEVLPIITEKDNKTN